MTNTQRLLLDTLPHWSGVTFITASELLGDMWIRGEKAGHHGALRFDPAGIDKLRTELFQDFVNAPPAASFRSNGAIQTIAHLDNEMQRFRQRPISASENLRASVPGRARRGLEVHLQRLNSARKPNANRVKPARRSTSKKTRRGNR